MRSALPLPPSAFRLRRSAFRLAAVLAIALPLFALAAAPLQLAPGSALNLTLSSAAPTGELSFTNDGTRLLALRVASTVPSAVVHLTAKAGAQFGEYGLAGELDWDFKSERAASQLFDALPQFPTTWSIALSLTGEEPCQLTVQLEDQGPAPAIRWAEATGTLLVRNAGGIQLVARHEPGTSRTHPECSGTTYEPEIAANGDSRFTLPAGYWQLIASGTPMVRETSAVLIPVSSGGETVVDWPKQQPTCEPKPLPEAAAGLVLCAATADTTTGRLLVAAPMFDSAPKPESVQVFEGGQPGEVISVEAVPTKLHVVVLFDSSFSMRKIFTQAQAAALRFVEKLPPDATVDFFDFATEVKELPASDRAGLLKAIGAMQANGSTKLYDSVIRGLEKCAAHRRSAIVLFTDGFDAQVEAPAYGSRASQAEVFAAVAKAQVPLFTIAYGEKPDEATLKRLASASHGACFRAQPDTIAGVFDQIGRLVDRDYRITYRRPGKAAACNTPVLTLVLDVSGSMDMNPSDEGCGFRIEKAKDLLRGFFRRLPAGSVVQLFTFSSEVNLAQVPTTDPSRLLRALTQVEAGGSTETLAATQAALASIEQFPSRNRYLLFITDAALAVEPEQRTAFTNALAALKKLAVRSIWIGMVGPEEQAPFENAAALSGGSFVVSPNTDALAQALAALEQTLNDPAAAGNAITVDVQIAKPGVPAAETFGGTGVFPLPSTGSTSQSAVSSLTVTTSATTPAGPLPSP